MKDLELIISESADYVTFLYDTYDIYDICGCADEWVEELFTLTISESTKNRMFLLQKHIAYSEVLKIRKKLHICTYLDGVVVERHIDDAIVLASSIGLPDLLMFSIVVDIHNEIFVHHNGMLYLRLAGLLFLNDNDSLESVGKIWETDFNERRSCTYIGIDDSGLYKIGKSTNIKSRIKAHATSNPSFKCLYYVCDDIESQLHARFDNARISGEFFALGKSDIELILRDYGFIGYNGQDIISSKKEFTKSCFDTKGNDDSLMKFVKKFGRPVTALQGNEFIGFDKSGLL